MCNIVFQRWQFIWHMHLTGKKKLEDRRFLNWTAFMALKVQSGCVCMSMGVSEPRNAIYGDMYIRWPLMNVPKPRVLKRKCQLLERKRTCQMQMLIVPTSRPCAVANYTTETHCAEIIRYMKVFARYRFFEVLNARVCETRLRFASEEGVLGNTEMCGTDNGNRNFCMWWKGKEKKETR